MIECCNSPSVVSLAGEEHTAGAKEARRLEVKNVRAVRPARRTEMWPPSTPPSWPRRVRLPVSPLSCAACSHLAHVFLTGSSTTDS